jgi:uncharacterized protein with PIN domain
MAQIYADENFPGPIVRHLRTLGHDVLTAHEDGRANQQIADPDVLTRAIALGRAVLTTDRRDYHRLHRGNPAHAGIITCTRDPDFIAVAELAHAEISILPTLAGRLVKIIRPSNPPQLP